jgi:hypothetical protein
MGIIFRKSKSIIVEKGKETKGLKKNYAGFTGYSPKLKHRSRLLRFFNWLKSFEKSTRGNYFYGTKGEAAHANFLNFRDFFQFPNALIPPILSSLSAWLMS